MNKPPPSRESIWLGEARADMKTTIVPNIRRGADKSLAFPICSTNKRIFLGWVKEIRTTKT
jgi:hypothetical protein